MTASLFARLAHRFESREALVSRRLFLKASALATGAAIAGCAAGGDRPGRGKRIVIIGGGFAGLSAALALADAGAEPVLLEARGRVGGRVLSFADFVPGKVIEGGGELIGANHPTWIRLAERFGLSMLDVTEEEGDFPVLVRGELLTGDASLRLYEEMEEAIRPLNELAADIDPVMPWTSPGAAAIDAIPVSSWLAGQRMSDLCRHALDVTFAADNAVPTARMSLLGLLAMVKAGGLEDYWTQSEVYRCRGGNQQLALRLRDALGTGTVRTGAAVRSVRRTGGGITVFLEDGESVSGDGAVLATPPSTWGRIDFTPGLPRDLMPQMGVAVKHLSSVRGRFWRAIGRAPDGFTDADVNMTWEGTDNQPGDANAGVVAFSGASSAEALRERSMGDRSGVVTGLLERLFPGYGSQVMRTRFMDWPGDPMTGAGYAFPAPGELGRIGPVVAKGLGRLAFAGEHTSHGFVGYMEGAWRGGVRAAARVLGAVNESTARG